MQYITALFGTNIYTIDMDTIYTNVVNIANVINTVYLVMPSLIICNCRALNDGNLLFEDEDHESLSSSLPRVTVRNSLCAKSTKVYITHSTHTTPHNTKITSAAARCSVMYHVHKAVTKHVHMAINDNAMGTI